MNREQKRELVWLVLNRVGDLVEYGELLEGTKLEDVPMEEIQKQLTTWMKQLPSDVWDNRLPKP